MEKAAAKTEEERKIAEERKKAKEAQAKMELHQQKAKHAAEKLNNKYHHGAGLMSKHHANNINEPVMGTAYGQKPAVGTATATAAPMAPGATVPMAPAPAGPTVPTATYPIGGGHRQGHKHWIN